MSATQNARCVVNCLLTVPQEKVGLRASCVKAGVTRTAQMAGHLQDIRVTFVANYFINSPISLNIGCSCSLIRLESM